MIGGREEEERGWREEKERGGVEAEEKEIFFFGGVLLEN